MGMVHEVLFTVVEIASLVIEIFGIGLMIYIAIKCMIDFFSKPHVQLELEKGICTSLSFLMCAEVLKTVTAESVQDLMILGGIVIIRSAMSLLLHWEMKREKEEIEEA